MMSREEMITIIRAHDAIQKLDAALSDLFNTEGLKGTQYEDALSLSDVLFCNCSFYKNETESYERFYEIIMDDELSAEEKYEKMQE